MRAFDGGLGTFADHVDVFADKLVPGHAVSFSTLGEAACVGGGAFLAGAHGVAIVFDDVDHREIPKGGQVEGFVEATLIDGAIAKVAKGGAFETAILETVGQAEAERGLTSDNAVATPVILVGREVMHGPALALGTTGGFSE